MLFIDRHLCVQVYLRLRPQIDKEPRCISVNDNETIVFQSKDHDEATLFKFSKVFSGEGAGQEALFDHVSKPMVAAFLRGTNALMFTYGVTGAGKTYTMQGDASNHGILQRTFGSIFQSIKSNKAPPASFSIVTRTNEIQVQVSCHLQS